MEERERRKKLLFLLVVCSLASACSCCSNHYCSPYRVGAPQGCSAPPRVPRSLATSQPCSEPSTTSLCLSCDTRFRPPLRICSSHAHLSTSLGFPAPWSTVSHGPPNINATNPRPSATCQEAASQHPTSPYPPTWAPLSLDCFLLPHHCIPAVGQTTQQTSLPSGGLHSPIKSEPQPQGRPPRPKFVLPLGTFPQLWCTL